MAKLTLNDLTSLANAQSAIASINANNTLIENAIENTLSRNGTSPNSMSADLDMNSNQILNLPEAVLPTEPVRKSEFDEAVDLLNSLAMDSLDPADITASEIESEEGIVNNKYMTPLRVAQATAGYVTPTASDVENTNISTAISAIRTTGRNEIGVGGGLYKTVDAEPSHDGKMESANGVWFEIAEKVLSPRQFKLDTDLDDTDSIKRCFAAAKEIDGKANIDFQRLDYDISDKTSVSDLSDVYIDATGAKFTGTFASQLSAFEFLEPTRVHWVGGYLDGQARNGSLTGRFITMRGPNDCTISKTHTFDNLGSAILVYANHDEADAIIRYYNTHIINCTQDGNGNAGNGILIESGHTCSIQGCVVRDLDRTSDPAWGLQFKNSCINCWINGGMAEGCAGGVVLGSDQVPALGEGPKYCYSSGVTVLNCTRGVVVQGTTHCRTSTLVDMASLDVDDSAGFYAAAHNVGGVHDVSIYNVHAARNAIYSRSANSSGLVINLKDYDVSGLWLMYLDVDAERNKLFIENLITTSTSLNPTSLVSDNSGNSTNSVAYARDVMVTGFDGSPRVYFNVPGVTRTSLLSMGTDFTYTFRSNGVDRVKIDVPNLALAPAADATLSLGLSGKRWTDIRAQLSNIEKYANSVTAIGSVTSGTQTPDARIPYHSLTNNGAFTLAASSNTGSYILDITNGSTAGAVTLTAFVQDGDSLDTVDTHKFRLWVSITPTGNTVTIKALQ